MATEARPLFNFYFRYKWNEVDFADFQDVVVGLNRDTLGSLFGPAVLSGGSLAPSGATRALTVSAYEAINSDGYLNTRNSPVLASISAADATHARKDLIVARPLLTSEDFITRPTSPFDSVPLKTSQDTQIVVIAGTPAVSPGYPVKAAGDVVLGGLFVAANATSFTSGNIDATVKEIYALEQERQDTQIALGDVVTRNWTDHSTSLANVQWTELEWSPTLKLFAAVAATGTAAQQIGISPDGITWTAKTAPSARVWASICWSPELGLFVAVAQDGTTAQQVMHSADALTWVASSGVVPSARLWTSICWSPTLNLFVAVAKDGTAAQQIMTSPDGDNWTARTAPSARTWNAVCWSPALHLFVAVADNGTAAQQIMYSSDGLTWTAATAPAARLWTEVCWSPTLGLFVAVASDTATFVIMTSVDGINWLGYNSPNGSGYRTIEWSEKLRTFVAGGVGGSTPIGVSHDGANWRNTPPPVAEVWVGIAWSDYLSQFCAITDTDGTHGHSVLTF